MDADMSGSLSSLADFVKTVATEMKTLAQKETTNATQEKN
jgi:hypothetical protein